MMDGAHRLMLRLLLQFEVEVKVDGQLGLLFCVSFYSRFAPFPLRSFLFAQGLSSLSPMSTSSVDSLPPNLPYCSFSA